MRFGVADYGLNVWDGGFYNLEERLRFVKSLGYEGIERLEAVSASDALTRAAVFRKLGLDFSTCRGPNVSSGIEWTAGLGKGYVWLTPHPSDRSADMAAYLRHAKAMARSAAGYGVDVAVHNHMDQRIESQAELETLLNAVPEMKMVLDTGHLSMAGGDPVAIIDRYASRIAVMHFKEVFLTGGQDAAGRKEYRFCNLGEGNNGQDTRAIVQALVRNHWDGWCYIELDSHQSDPAADLTLCLSRLREWLG